MSEMSVVDLFQNGAVSGWPDLGWNQPGLEAGLDSCLLLNMTKTTLNLKVFSHSYS